MRVQWKLSHSMLHHQRGSEVDVQIKIGSNHSGDKQTQRSRNKVMLYT